jgi:hypothetical protein
MTNVGEAFSGRVLTFSRFVELWMRNKDAAHDMVHVRNVVAHYRCIASSPGFTEHMRLVGELVALGHELCDDAKDGMLARVRKVLTGLGFSASVVGSAVHLIPLVSCARRTERDLPALFDEETAIYLAVSDADMLESLGVVGFARSFACRAQSSPGEMLSALRHVEDVLLLCEEYMTSDYAKEEAAKRAATMRQLCLAYRDERPVR